MCQGGRRARDTPGGGGMLCHWAASSLLVPREPLSGTKFGAATSESPPEAPGAWMVAGRRETLGTLLLWLPVRQVRPGEPPSLSSPPLSPFLSPPLPPFPAVQTSDPPSEPTACFGQLLFHSMPQFPHPQCSDSEFSPKQGGTGEGSVVPVQAAMTSLPGHSSWRLWAAVFPGRTDTQTCWGTGDM